MTDPRRASTRSSVEHFTGCLLGGAVGDALGAPTEFQNLREIQSKYGPPGITGYDVAYGRRGAITDDTQMTLFTAEGVLRAITRQHHKGICSPPGVIHHAYMRWLRTQGEPVPSTFADCEVDGWLIEVKELHDRREPGNTCLSALRSGKMGTPDEPLNNSKGCGGVMRAAPVGLAGDDADAAFSLGCDVAAITHGNPSGYYAAGSFAAIVCCLREGMSLPAATEHPLERLDRLKHGEECATAIRKALSMWRDHSVTPGPEAIERLGRGWTGEEALAIALYCALHAGDDFSRGVLLAVNHGGDSDSTGAIAGNLLGLMLGVGAITDQWLHDLELRHEIEAIARDLHTRFRDSPEWWDRYPGW